MIMQIILARQLALRIEDRIRSILADESVENTRIRGVVQRTGALPLSSDSGGGFALTSKGDIIAFLWDSPEVTAEKDQRLINLALFQGSKKYAELEAIRPSRTASAEECPYCHGTGYPDDAPESLRDSIVCYCGGLGWVPNVPPGTDETESR